MRDYEYALKVYEDYREDPSKVSLSSLKRAVSVVARLTDQWSEGLVEEYQVPPTSLLIESIRRRKLGIMKALSSGTKQELYQALNAYWSRGQSGVMPWGDLEDREVITERLVVIDRKIQRELG